MRESFSQLSFMLFKSIKLNKNCVVVIFSYWTNQESPAGDQFWKFSYQYSIFVSHNFRALYSQNTGLINWLMVQGWQYGSQINVFLFTQSSITCDKNITQISPKNYLPMIKVTLQSSTCMTCDRDITRTSSKNSIPMIKVTLQGIVIPEDYWAWREK